MPPAALGALPVRLVVPCYDEERRLSLDRFAILVSRLDVGLLFVDDGSRDRTCDVLNEFARGLPGRVGILRLPANRGKAEAVRAGLLTALEQGARTVGYLDADLSTPPEEVLRLLSVMDEGRALAVLGSRVRLLGTRIERRALRHYRGRVFATAASLALGLPVYDTQCGAKLFRSGPALARALAEPFRARWAFDVELIGRLVMAAGDAGLGAEDIVEVPLRQWTDVAGSKLGAWQMLRSAGDLVGIAYRLRRARAGGA
jgi:dolichyl-phosphate beta-glucosyltransferase